MHVCYLYLSSILSPRLLAESLAIKYKTDNPKPLFLDSAHTHIGKGVVWPSKSIVYCSCIAVLPPVIEEKILPICSKTMGIFCQAVLSVMGSLPTDSWNLLITSL